MRRELEEKNRQMLRAEYLVAFSVIITGLVMVFVAAFIEISTWLRIVLLAFVLVMILTVAFIAVGIEQKAGYYECQKCHHRYMPTYWQVNLVMHTGRTRYMKCPACCFALYGNVAGRGIFLLIQKQKRLKNSNEI